MSIRLDKYLLGQFETRTKAADAIKAGRVQVNGKVITKPGFSINENDQVEVEEKKEYVSRAAYKLKAAFDAFQFSIEDKVCLDIGASTGGFSQICLEQKAKKVYALDVGHLQLAKVLEEDRRIVKMEGVNAREIKADMFAEPIDFICMDVSFISAKTILKPVLKELHPASIVFLIKPQFECGPQALNKNGVLKNEKIRTKIIEDMRAFAKQYFSQVRIIDSPLAGRSGNVEALLYAYEPKERGECDDRTAAGEGLHPL
jgi:23S rRNA (cytidine1920-2'-O)/16S rRNA (cytidine1409-2'-O)-methyltransferase